MVYLVRVTASPYKRVSTHSIRYRGSSTGVQFRLLVVKVLCIRSRTPAAWTSKGAGDPPDSRIHATGLGGVKGGCKGHPSSISPGHGALVVLTVLSNRTQGSRRGICFLIR